DPRPGDAAGTAGIERPRHLGVHTGIVDNHLRAGNRDGDLDAERRVEVAAVIVEEALRLVDPVRDIFHHPAGRRLGLVPDLVDADGDGVLAVALQELRIAPAAELAGGDLGAQIAEAGIRVADIV